MDVARLIWLHGLLFTPRWHSFNCSLRLAGIYLLKCTQYAYSLK